MKTHTSDLKNNIKRIGRVLDSKITYTLDNEEIVLGMTDLNSVTPNYTTSLLKSVMKQLDIDSNVEIPEGTIINYQLGVLVNGNFEYLNYGNYVVYKVEKQEDVKSYKITCYDKMLYAMKDYEAMNLTYPITIRNYIGAVATHLGLTFANASDTFANYNREIQNELYLDSEGNSLGYTFRDVLDELAQTTASNICINEETDELEVRYIKDATINEAAKGSSLKITDSEEASLVNFEIEGKTVQNGTPSPANPIELSSVGYTNLFDKDNIQMNATISSTGTPQYNNGSVLSGFIKVNPNTNYYLSSVRGGNFVRTYAFYNNNKEYISFGAITGAENVEGIIKTTDATHYIRVVSGADYYGNCQVNEGTTKKEFIDYGKYGIEIKTTNEENENTYLYTLDQPLRSIGNTKDLLYIKNGKLYIDRYIRHIELAIADMDRSDDYPGWNNVPYLHDDYPNYNTAVFPTINIQSNIRGNRYSFGLNTNNLNSILLLNKAAWNLTQTQWKTQYPNLILNLEYELLEPHTEELGDVEIPSTYEGTTYLTTTDEIEPSMNIEYIKEYDKINEEFFKDINVTFKEKYGPINSIVLSRAGGSDNIYLQDETSIEENGLCEIKITDNQIMNWNDRSDYLPDILDQLDGLEYYLNDYSSTGIFYYNICDRYYASVDGNSYPCVMFNNEVNITQGAEENVYTDMPEETETEYTKADKTDRKINQTYIMVDKQNGRIDALASSVQDLTDFLKTVEGTGTITLDNTVASNGAIGRLEITGITEMGLYPGMIYPSDKVYPSKLTSYIIVQENENRTEHYETYIDLGFPLIPTDKLIIENGKVSVKRANGNINTNIEAILKTFEGKTNISVKFFDNVNIKCEYIEKNEFTKYFATEAELSSSIIITDEQISSKVSKAEVISEINQSAEQIQIDANKISLEGKEINLTSDNIIIDSDNFTVDEEGNMTCNGATANNLTVENGKISLEGLINEAKFSIFNTDTSDYGTSIIKISPYNFIASREFLNGKEYAFTVNSQSLNLIEYQDEYKSSVLEAGYLELRNSNGATIKQYGSNGNITCVSLTQTSLEKNKKNFEKYNGALNEVLNTDIYKYNLNFEKDTDKKHLGFVIGNNYNYSKEITSLDNEGNEIGVDNYSMTSLCLQAIKEQQEIINNMQLEIDKLKEMIKNA